MSSDPNHCPNPLGAHAKHQGQGAGGGRPLKFQSVDELEKSIEAYFGDPESKPYTVSGLAYALGTDRSTLMRYQSEPGREMFFNTIKNAKARIEAFTTQFLFKPGTAAGVIFNLYNNFGDWKQRQDVNVGGQEGNPVQIKIDFGDKDQECKK